MKCHLYILLLWTVVIGCQTADNPAPENPHTPNTTLINTIDCSDSACIGLYLGPEFVKGDDIAHQFSNTMAWAVGDALKTLYADGKFSKVDLSNIVMTTEGMGSGNVEYALHIPLIRVADSCKAFTSFDHVGGWNHTPALKSRVNALNTALLPGDTLSISNLHATPEGLQEYWIQWRNKDVQSHCID